MKSEGPCEVDDVDSDDTETGEKKVAWLSDAFYAFSGIVSGSLWPTRSCYFWHFEAIIFICQSGRPSTEHMTLCTWDRA